MWQMSSKYRKPKKRMSEKNRHYLMRFVFMVVAVANLSAFVAWQNVKGLQLDVKLNKLRNNERILYEKYYHQLLIYENLRQSLWIESLARKKLNMHQTQNSDFLILKKLKSK